MIKVSRERLKVCYFLPFEYEEVEELLGRSQPDHQEVDRQISENPELMDEDLDEQMQTITSPPQADQMGAETLMQELPFNDRQTDSSPEPDSTLSPPECIPHNIKDTIATKKEDISFCATAQNMVLHKNG